MKKSASAESVKSRQDKRMDAWAAAKLSYRNHGGRNWKAAKKRVKRHMRDSRRLKNKLIDNATLAV